MKAVIFKVNIAKAESFKVKIVKNAPFEEA
jgi:hypothetical protein